jgi:hypothetical protein
MPRWANSDQSALQPRKNHSWVRGANPLYLVILLRVVLGVADRPKELAAL